MSIAPPLRPKTYNLLPPLDTANFNPPLLRPHPLTGTSILTTAWIGAVNIDPIYRSIDPSIRHERFGMVVEIASNCCNANARIGLPVELQPNLPPHRLDWSNVLLGWLVELSRLTRGEQERAVRSLGMAVVVRGGPEGGAIGSDDVWRATVLCEREDARRRGPRVLLRL